MTVLVDQRAGSAELAQPLSKMLACEVKLDLLSSGDVAWEGNYQDGPVAVGLEFKKVPDLILSGRSGRYQDQIRRMSEEYRVSYLLIEGNYGIRVEDRALKLFHQGTWTHYHPNSYLVFDGFLASVEAMENVIVRRANSRQESLQQIVDLYRWWQKPWAEHKSTKQIKTQASTVYGKDSTFVQMACQLPGVGPMLAHQLESKFGCFQKLAMASVEHLCEVDKIGQGKAQVIFNALRGIK